MVKEADDYPFQEQRKIYSVSSMSFTIQRNLSRKIFWYVLKFPKTDSLIGKESEKHLKDKQKSDLPDPSLTTADRFGLIPTPFDLCIHFLPWLTSAPVPLPVRARHRTGWVNTANSTWRRPFIRSCTRYPVIFQLNRVILLVPSSLFFIPPLSLFPPFSSRPLPSVPSLPSPPSADQHINPLIMLRLNDLIRPRLELITSPNTELKSWPLTPPLFPWPPTVSWPIWSKHAQGGMSRMRCGRINKRIIPTHRPR